MVTQRSINYKKNTSLNLLRSRNQLNRNFALYTRVSILLILWIHCSAGMLALGSLLQSAHHDDVGWRGLTTVHVHCNRHIYLGKHQIFLTWIAPLFLSLGSDWSRRSKSAWHCPGCVNRRQDRQVKKEKKRWLQGNSAVTVSGPCGYHLGYRAIGVRGL